MAQFIANPSWLGRFFTRIKYVTIEQASLVVYFKNKTSYSYPIGEFTNFSQLKKVLFSGKITFITNKSTVISFLNKQQAKSLNDQLNVLVASSLEQKVNKAKTLLKQYATSEYLRDSNIPILSKSVFSLAQQFSSAPALWQQYLSPVNVKFLTILNSAATTELAVAELRQQYEQKQLAIKGDFYNKVESNPLTLEQRLSVIRDNDKNLVLAAAGTGKTSVMIAKSLDLIAHNTAKPEQILILAYNKNAANELKARFEQRAKHAGLKVQAPSILTFHALGLKLLQSAEQSPLVSKFTTNPMLLNQWLTQWVSNKIKSDPTFCKAYIDLLNEPKNIVSHKPESHHTQIIKNSQYQSLAGYKVQGYQQLLISNWLYLYGIDHNYTQGKNTDFYLPKYNIYLVHFNIDRKGNPLFDIKKASYSEQITHLRKQHKQNNTPLIETFDYNWQEGKLEQRLKAQLLKHKVVANFIGEQKVYERLTSTGQLKQSIEKYLSCLSAIRVEQLSASQLVERIKQGGIKNYKNYATLLSTIHSAYTHELNTQGAIDFDDMVVKAANLVKAGKAVVPWSHILVDEFQDISRARMAFLNTLIKYGDNIRFTAVGDDWQAIYRFSGGNLALTTRFNNLVGSHTLTMLQKTFRYNNSISEVAGRFVMQNPEQYKKQITTHTQVQSPQVILLDDIYQGSKSVAEKVQQTIATINKNNSAASIAVIARYRFMLNGVQKHLEAKPVSNPVHFWTLHGSKGLEADYCIIIGFEQGKLGFPSEHQGNNLVEALLPVQDKYPHSEERRLLYVGITRSKHKAYLIADPHACSTFISELINDNYPIHIASKLFNKPPS